VTRASLRLFAVVVTVLAVFGASHLRLSGDLTTLFPRTPEATMLARVTRAFGSSGVGLVLVRGDDVAAASAAASAAAEELRACDSVRSVTTTAPSASEIDPTEAWRFAGPIARERLAQALTEEGMRQRLRETRSLLLAPGASDAASMLARDPLRLSMIPWQDQIELAAGVRGSAGASFVADGGRTRLVAVEPRGSAFESAAAVRFGVETDAALDRVRARFPGVHIDLAGGHVIARQMEALLRSDLHKSALLSVVLASLAFAVSFRRVRALVAVLPPLALGTLWTTALATLLFDRLSGVATAFAAVVIGVGVDTGVHVYGRLLRARADGFSPHQAADIARAETWKPTLGAALAAGGAFGCLVLSEVEGMRQLGVLCAAGEILTAIAILVIVPDVGALLERKSGASLPRASWVYPLTNGTGRAVVALASVATVLVLAFRMGMPRVEYGVVSPKARALPALAVDEAIHDAFGGSGGQWVVIAADRNGESARARADAVAETAERLVASGALAGFDALSRVAPSEDVQRARLAERDRLDLPSRAKLLQRVLAEEGFSLDVMVPAIEAFEHPSAKVEDVLRADEGVIAFLRRRHLATDSGETLAVTYVRLGNAPGAAETVRTALRGADPDAVITGFVELERGLMRSVAHDLPRVLAGAFAIVVVVLGASFRRPSRVLLAVFVLVVEIAFVLVLSRLVGVRWHAYDMLVLPVLLGITLDEVLFLVEAAERTGSIERAIVEQAPLGIATALTTAAGFAALVVCRFEGLADVGKVGALGSTAGIVVSLVVVPAAYRLFGRPAKA
jgi:predicted RND superfamily exporter protein